MTSHTRKILSLGLPYWKFTVRYISCEINLASTCLHYCRYSTLSSNSSLFVNRNNVVNISQRLYSSATVKDMKTSLTEKAKLEKKMNKKKEPEKIILITETNKINVVSLEEAGRLAKKGGFHLIEVDGKSENLKTDAPVYKLVTADQFFGEDIKKPKDRAGSKTKEKEEKTIMLKSKTSEHDILIKVKQIKKFAEKGHLVKVFIGQAGEGTSPENVYKTIENNLKSESCRILQKVTKSSQIQFQVAPPKAVTIKQFANDLQNQENRAKQIAQKSKGGGDDDDDDDAAKEKR